MSEIVQLVRHDGRGDFDRGYMTSILELTLVTDQAKFDSTTPGYKLCEAMKSPRCMISHCPECFLPLQVMLKKAKVGALSVRRGVQQESKLVRVFYRL